MAPAQILIGIASRPLPSETANGDATSVAWHGPVCRLAVIDGLGHGPEAARAAGAARQICEDLPDLAPVLVVEACHRALHGLRGGAISVARIDTAASRLTLAGVGNVAAQLRQGGREQMFSPDRGIAGARLPRIQPLEIDLLPAWTLAVYTDGIEPRFQLPEESDAPDESLAALARALLQRWAQPRDDATLAIVRCALC